ncbi:MAG: hypothetical protein IJ429_01345 [Lachnospiraceae bacterium]|nr:hypothetical protein [Lachnospiraceae bacterium]
MKKKIAFFVKLIVLTVILFLFCFVLVMPQYSGNYQASMTDKVEKLKNTEGPKIVLIGNSNLAFGIDSKRIEEAFGMPVVNMGLHGGVGNAFNEQAAKYNVDEGDIYIIAHTNYDDADEIKNPVLAWITIENHTDLYPLVRPKDWPDMIMAYPTYLKKCLTLWRTETGNGETNDAYRRSAFNEYGDNYYPRPETTGDIDFSPVVINHINSATAQRLNELNSYLTERGAAMLVAAYPVAVYEKTPSPEQYYKMGQEMADALDCPVISDFRDYMLDKTYFYDTHSHLTDEGTRLRTEQLIEDIQTYMDGRDVYSEN